VAAEAAPLAEPEALALDVTSPASSQSSGSPERNFRALYGRIIFGSTTPGIYLKAPVVDKTEEDWDRTLDIISAALFSAPAPSVPALRRQKRRRHHQHRIFDRS